MKNAGKEVKKKEIENKVKIYTKDELIEMMNKNLGVQIEMANNLKRKYDELEECKTPDERKERNSIQTQLNTQYDAINRSCNSIIKINNCKLENIEEDNDSEEKKPSPKKELVD